MKLLDILNGPWAIRAENLVEIQAIYCTHLRGESIDIAAIEARLGRPLANEPKPYTVRPDGVAVLPIDGVLAPKMNLLTQVSGGTSTNMVKDYVQAAIADPQVNALILAIDSPGGSVQGAPELAATVRELAAVKPIVAVTDGIMASAAYWIGSAANAVYATGPTVQVGSIGVVARHIHTPQSDGTQVTEITAGKYKRIDSSSKPLSSEGAAYLQNQVDHIYQVFVDAVAANRGVSTDAVLSQMADGRVFIGQQSLDAGLIDGFSSIDALAAQLASNPGLFTPRRYAGIPQPIPKRTTTMIDKTALPDGTAEAERQRIASVLALGDGITGHESLIEQLAFDGKTTAGEAAKAVVAAERRRLDRASNLADRVIKSFQL